MMKRSWIRQLFARPVSSTIRKAPRRVRPALEVLEDRCVPSTFTVLNALDDGSVGSLRWAVGQANSTTVVYLAASNLPGKGLFVTNSANERLIIGRNTTGIFFVTNGTVTAGTLIMGNASAGANSVILSGANTYWTNASTAKSLP